MKSRRRRYGLIGIGALVPVVVAAGVAIGQSNAQPADKVVAAASKTEEFGPNQDVTLLTANMKTSKPTDLMIHTALECTILSELSTGGTAPDSAETTSNVDVWIEFDGEVVPLQATSSPPQNGSTPPAGDDSDKVTFCNRTYNRTVTDGETDGTDNESDYLETKSTHGFNWVKLNTGSGTHVIEVKADLEQAEVGTANAEATIGKRTLVVEPTKMANNAVISDTGN